MIKKIIWFFAMMTMFYGTIMLTITFLPCVKSGYSPMKCMHFKLKDKNFQMSLKISFQDHAQHCDSWQKLHDISFLNQAIFYAAVFTVLSLS